MWKDGHGGKIIELAYARSNKKEVVLQHVGERGKADAERGAYRQYALSEQSREVRQADEGQPIEDDENEIHVGVAHHHADVVADVLGVSLAASLDCQIERGSVRAEFDQKYPIGLTALKIGG